MTSCTCTDRCTCTCTCDWVQPDPRYRVTTRIPDPHCTSCAPGADPDLIKERDLDV